MKQSTFKPEDIKAGLVIKSANKDVKLKDVMKVSRVVADGILLNFSQKGAYPESAVIKLYAGNLKGIKPADTVYLYFFNEKTRKLEELPTSQYLLDKKGYITMDIGKGGSYVLLRKKPNTKVITPILSQISVKAWNMNIQKGKTADVNLTLPTTLLVVNSFHTDKVSKKGVKGLMLTYETSNSRVATVSSAGKLMAINAGKAIITVTAKLSDGRHKVFKITITVK